MFVARDDACTQRVWEKSSSIDFWSENILLPGMEKLQQLFCRLILGVNYLHIILHKKYPTWNDIKWRRIKRKESVSWF